MWTSAPAWLKWVAVKLIPNLTGVSAIPRRITPPVVSARAFQSSTARRRAA